MRIGGKDLGRIIDQGQRLEDFEAKITRAADAGSIVEFFDVPTADAFDVPPTQAINYFAAKGLRPTFSYADMLGEAHDHAFTVAKMMDVDMLGQVRASLDSALANGTQFKEWADSLIPTLQSAGWWGKKEVIDPLTGQAIVAQLGSPWRLETIFRTNMQTAYAAGAWQEIEQQAEFAPFLMYDAVDDFRTREQHRLWDRKVVPVNSPWWKTHYPPNGWNCRCGVIQLDATEVKRLGLNVEQMPQSDGTYTWKNPRTGESVKLPNGIDPGFGKNSGVSYLNDLQKLLDEKISAQTASMQAAAKAAQLKMAEIDAINTATAEELLKAEQIAAANLGALRARVIAQAKEQEAQIQLDAIAKGKEAIVGVGAQYKVKALAQLSKDDIWPELKPTEQLALLDELAAQLKFQNETASKLAGYKKAVLAGKSPAPNQVKAFEGLSPAEQAKFVEKLEAEKAKLAAAKQAEAEAAAKAAAATANADAPPTQKVASLLNDQAPDPADLVLVGAKTKGSNEGGIYQDKTTGIRYMVKFNGSEDNVRNEVLAGKLYQLAGMEAPDLYSIRVDGRPAIASRMVDGIKEVGPDELRRVDSVMDGYAVDAWLANWDAIGLSYDNTVLLGGRALRIDVGGSLRYRAQGGLKGNAFGDAVTEIESLRDPSLNRTSYEVFKNITQDQIEAGVVKVLRTSDDDIRAVVEQYGPLDATERAALAAKLIARKQDLARRYPAAAARARGNEEAPNQAPPAVARVTESEQRFVEDSRVNGYGFPSDSDQIEDHMVVVHAFKRADGTDATRGFFKLRDQAGRELAKRIAESVEDTAPSVSVANAREAILAAVKSVNYRADKGSPFDTQTSNKVKNAILETRAALKALDAASAQAKDLDGLLDVYAHLDEWLKKLENLAPAITAGGKATKLPGMFNYSTIPDRFELEAPQVKAAGMTWKRVNGEYEFQTARFERSFAQETKNTARVSGTSLRYEAQLPDGTKVVYFPHDSNVAWSMQGVVKIDAPGKGAASSGRVFEAMKEIGIKSERATEIDRKHLYVNAFARIRLLRGDMATHKALFEAIDDQGQAGLDAKLAILKNATGIDVEKSNGWRTIEGVRQAFGHGRAYQLRPDLDTAEFEQFAKQHILYHNPQGLGTDAGSGVFNSLKPVIEGGGTLASLTDRVRRGVPLSGSSVSSDLASGGGDYVFTRIKRRGTTGTGVYWRANQAKRMDAITYDSDKFGRTTGDTIDEYRKGQDVASLRYVADSSSNETIFKGGISLFDDIDRIVLSSQAEVKEAIDWMKQRGYKTWPDGRQLAEVIITKAKNSENP
jgi:SPP1 gp7 family putative phage head morphogenesis protein